MEEKTLVMKFKNEDGKYLNIRVSNPKDSLTGTQVKDFMDDVILKNIFEKQLVAKVSAEIVTVSHQELILV